MIRGGSWNNTPADARAANRNRNDPRRRNDNQGFRLVRSVGPSTSPRSTVPMPDADMNPIQTRRDPEQAPLRRSRSSRGPTPPTRSGKAAPRGPKVRVGTSALLVIHDPKPRVIARSTASDRLVHMALTSLMEPVYEPSMMPEDLACRPGGGTHRAVQVLQRQMRQHRFALHLDIKRYFPSIDLDILRGLLRRRIRDDAFLGVLDLVLDAGAGLLDQPGVRAFLGVPPDWPPAGRGLPVGAFTSQFLATHVYLNGLDHFIKRAVMVPGYLRYVDDLFLFGGSRAELRRWRQQIGAWLLEERGLVLKHPSARVLSCAGRLDGLGYRIRRDEIRVSERAIRRLRGRVRAWLEAPESAELHVHLRRSLAGSMGVLLG